MLNCDRSLVSNTLRRWYGDDAEDDGYLDAFDDLVRSRLNKVVLRKMRRTYVPFEYTFYLLCSATLAFLPWHASELKYSSYDADGYGYGPGDSIDLAVVSVCVEYVAWTVVALCSAGLIIRSFSFGGRLEARYGRIVASLALTSPQ